MNLATPASSYSSPSTQRSRVRVRVSACKPGDLSYELVSTEKNPDDSLSFGSAVSADSFIIIDSHTHHSSIEDEDGSQQSYDPYLDEARQRRRCLLKSQSNKENRKVSRTPETSPLDDSTTTETNRSTSSHLRPILTSIELPMKRFDAPSEEQDVVPTRREACAPHQVKALHERNHWNAIVTQRIQYHGMIHLRVGEGLLLLGNAHMNCSEYSEALTIYKSAVRIFRKVKGDDDLTVARSLDKVGLAACRLRTKEGMHVSVLAMDEAFSIRYEKLGSFHVDTVDSLNNLAGVYARCREYALARKAYHEVYMVRQIIFGPRHPSVAITAHALGGVHMQLSQVEDAARYYNRALKIYKTLQLKSENPTMKRLLKDIAALERISSVVL